MIRFIERNGYDVSYTSQADADANAAVLRNHKIIVSSAHDEYWSGRRAHEHRGGARRRREPRVLQRQRGVLEDALAVEQRRRDRHPVPDADVVQGHALRRADRPGGVDRHLGRPAVHAARRRRAPAELAHRAAVHRQRRNVGHHRPGGLQEPAPVAEHGGGEPLRRPDRGRCRRAGTRSATSGTSTPTTASARPASSSSPRRR